MCVLTSNDARSHVLTPSLALLASLSDRFNNAQAFNQPIGDWETALVTNMNRMCVELTSTARRSHVLTPSLAPRASLGRQV